MKKNEKQVMLMPKDNLLEFNAGMFGNAMFIAPNNDFRIYLNGVFIKPCSFGGVNIIATDGHRLIYFYDELGSCSLNEGMIIPKIELKKFISFSRKAQNREKKIIVKSRISKKRIRKTHSISLDNKARDTYLFNPIDANFPDANRIITSQKVDNEKNNSILYNAKYVLDFKYLFVNRRNTEKHQIAINQNVDRQTLACTENAFYITMPLWGDTNKHMLDFIYGLADESDNIFQKAILRKRGIGGYKFIKDILGAKEAKAIKKPLMTR